MKKVLVSLIICCFFMSIILICPIIFLDSIDYFTVMVAEICSLLVLLIAIVATGCYYMLLKTLNKKLVKKSFVAILCGLIAIVGAYSFCVFISAYDMHIPEDYYINEPDYIQKFLPFGDVEDIKDYDDLMDSSVMYTNHPGYTKIEVVCNKKQYMMRYVQSLNPAYFIKHKLSVAKTLNASKLYLFQPEFDNVVTVYIDDVIIEVYTGDNDIYASAEKFGNYITVMAENCRYEYEDEQAFAELVYEQFALAEDCAKRQIFRDKPWYDIAYYIKRLKEPYVNIEYFSQEYYTA